MSARREGGHERPAERTLGELRTAVEALRRRVDAGALADAAIVARLDLLAAGLDTLASGLDALQRRHDEAAARLSARLARLERRAGRRARRRGGGVRPGRLHRAR